ncbi:MAG: hypothetical protein ABI895_30835 [Deltaproteobacteria bacterium]
MTEALVVDQLQRRADRVREHTPQYVNRRIAREIDIRVQHCLREGREALIERLGEIDKEWDIDRVVMANFAIVGGAAYLVGLRRLLDGPPWRARRTGWLYFFGAQLGFLLLHARVGWCPPVTVWRRLGVRTKTEIELERSLLLDALEPPLRHPEKENGAPRSSQAVS